MNPTQLPSGRWRIAVKHHGQRATGTADTACPFRCNECDCPDYMEAA